MDKFEKMVTLLFMAIVGIAFASFCSFNHQAAQNFKAQDGNLIILTEDVQIDASSDDFFRFYNEGDPHIDIKSNPAPRPDAPEAERLTITLPKGNWIVDGHNISLSFEKEITFNRRYTFFSVGVCLIIILLMIIIVVD